MTEIEKRLKEIELEFNNDSLIWTHLEEDDLLVTKSKNSRYIIGVKRFNSKTNMIDVKFIYSLQSDSFYPDDGNESPDRVERCPSSEEVDRLTKNVKYQIYLSTDEHQ